MGSLVLSSNQRLPAYIVFAGVSLVFVASQFLFFQGFNGTDDLHYAFLASRMLQGNFSPFVLNDSFAGRAIIVVIQALVYAVGGISTFTTLITSYIAIVVAGWLTIFNLMQAVSPRLVLLAASLFYFNPVLADISQGPSPDVFIVLAGVILLLLLKKLVHYSSGTANVIIGCASGFFVFSTLLIKESGLVFLPFAFIVGLFLPSTKNFFFCAALLVSFWASVALCGWVYYIHTGNFFFKVTQLKVAAYPNSCNYASFFQREMYVRLTYKVWQEFLSQNYLPVLLATVAVVHGLFSSKEKGVNRGYKRAFLILLLLGLYFPFSVSNYQPLCARARHFLFLLPLGTIISSQWLYAGYANPKKGWYRNLIAAVLVGISIKMSNSGWNWNFYRCLLAILVVWPFLIDKKLAAVIPVLLSAILWLCLPYRFIYQRTNWFPNLERTSTQLIGQNFYFPDHDNLMHWKLFRQFDTATRYFNLDQKPFHIDNPYYEKLRFNPGWFIVNKQYTVLSRKYVAQIDSLQAAHFFDSTIHNGPVSAYYFSNQRQYDVLKKGVEQEKHRQCNCDEPDR